MLTTSNNKNDPQDARTLAEIAWARPAQLRPVRHRSAEAQRDLNLVRARDLLVEAHEVNQRGAGSEVCQRTV